MPMMVLSARAQRVSVPMMVLSARAQRVSVPMMVLTTGPQWGWCRRNHRPRHRVEAVRHHVVRRFATIHNGILDGNIACQRINVDSTGHLFDCVGRCRCGCRCSSGRILEALHRHDAAPHKNTDPHQEKEQK
jgi:hypothetical protein